MMRSMFSGVTGLNTHQTKMDVIAHNIANVNTIGFKSSRVTFNEVFSQTIGGASRASASSGRGGRNPMQIGLGVDVNSIDVIMGQGAAQRTGGAYDVMIEGEGFFVVEDGSGQYFTRAGDFGFDAAGNFVNHQGMHVMGWNAQVGDKGIAEIEKGTVQRLKLTEADRHMPPEVTSNINFTGNLNADTDKIQDSKISFYDSIGNEYVIDVQYEYIPGESRWEMSMGNYAYRNGDRKDGAIYLGDDPFSLGPSQGTDNTAIKDMTIQFQDMPDDPPAHKFNKVDNGFLKFNKDGYPIVDGSDGPDNFSDIKLIIDPGTVVDPDSRFGDPILLSFGDATQHNGEADFSGKTLNGNGPGRLGGLAIGSDGIIVGSYTNGASKIIGQIAIAEFENPAGLEKAGANLFRATMNSGEFDGRGIEGSLLSGSLEMSQVDLAYEFTEMITTQRGFQANSRIISTSDEMLQELVNLKR